MNLWMIAALLMIFSLFPAGWRVMTGGVEHRVVGMQLGGVLCTLALMLLTMAFHRMPMMDLAVALALLSFASGMVFAHFLARYL